MDDHRSRTARLVVVLVLAGVAAAGAWVAARPAPDPVAAQVTGAAPGSTAAPGITAAPGTTAPAGRAAGKVTLRPDGLGVVAFGAAEQAAVRELRRSLGRWQERGSWPDGQTAFGTCTGGVKALRWGRLYVLFTNGQTPYGPEGTWHLSAWQVTSWKVFPVIPTADPRPLGGLSPRTPEGIGVGATVARLRAAYRDRLELWGGPEGGGPGFRVAAEGAARGLHGSLSGASPAGRVRSLAAGATCGE